MNLFQEKLSIEEVKYLKKIIGSRIPKLYGIQLRRDLTENSYRSFGVLIPTEKNDNLFIFNKSKETPNEIDYYELKIEIQKDLDTKIFDTEFETGMQNHEISEIRVYCKYEKWEDEIVEYDNLLMFILSNNLSFIIYLFEDSSDQLEITNDLNLIEQELKLSTLRLIINSEHS